MREPFEYFTTVAADVINHTIINSFFTGRETGYIEVISLFNRIEAIISISEVNIPVNWPMYPCLTIFRKKECPIKGIEETLNIVKCLLQGQWSDILALIQQILNYSVNLAI